MRTMLVAIGVAVTLSACAPPPPPPPAPPATAPQPAPPPAPQPAPPPAPTATGQPGEPRGAAAEAAAAVNQLGAKLWAEQPRATNVFYSPYSIHQALGQLYLGAAGATRTQIGQLLRATGDDAADQAGWRALAAALRPRQGLESAFTLHSANGIFAQRGHPFRREYLRAVGAGEGGAEARELDYEGQPEAARVAINDWVSEQTTGTITGAVGPDVLTANTRLVLVNAVYFKAAWLDQFDEQATTAGTFTLHDGTEVTLPFMHARSELEYVETPEFQAVRLPYVGGQTSALVILPRPGAAETVESTFSALSLDEHLGAARERRVVLALPRFALRPALSLAENLRALGLTDAFVPGGADFSALDGTRDLYLSEALHDAYVKVDEQGTEAAAVTSVSMGTLSLSPPPEPVVMTVDRPFLFLVRDDATGALLFMGRIADPRG